MPFEALSPDIACEVLAEIGLECAPSDVHVEAREERWVVRLPGQHLAWFAASRHGLQRLQTERRLLRLLEARCTFCVPRVLFESATGNKLTQGDSGDSVYVQSNVVGNTIIQGKGADYLCITPSVTSKDNVFDGGTSSWGLIFEDKDAVRFRGKREDYTFTFHANGEFTVIHKPTGANPGIFRNYEEVYFDDSADAIPLKQIEEEARVGA